MTEKEYLKTGTTTVGLACKDGVVLATERRATMGTLIAHKMTRKLFKIDDNIGMTIAGLVGDAQTLTRYMKAEVELYRLKRKEPITVKGASTMLSNIMSGQRYFPYWVALIVAGMDNKGPHVYSLDAAGGAIEDEYVTTGSGSPFVYGVLEDHFKKDVTVEEGIDLAIRGISVAMKRDAASGNGIDVATITRTEGFRPVQLKAIVGQRKTA